MPKETEHTCALFFKVTSDQALESIAGDLERLLMVVRSHLTEAVEMNGTRNATEERYADPATKRRRVPFADARAQVKVLPDLKIHRNGKWESIT